MKRNFLTRLDEYIVDQSERGSRASERERCAAYRGGVSGDAAMLVNQPDRRQEPARGLV